MDQKKCQDGTRDWIATAVKKLELSSQVALVKPHRFQSILERIVDQRTLLGSDAISASWWWEALREPAYCTIPTDPVRTLKSLIRANEPVWFVAEASGEKQIGNFWLYETTIEPLCAVLAECPHFEYYVVGKKMDWLICENHHGVLMANGDEMATRLSEVWSPMSRGE